MIMKPTRTLFFVLLLLSCESNNEYKTQTKPAPQDETQKKDSSNFVKQQDLKNSFQRVNEKVVLEFDLENKKHVSICIDKKRKYMVYRFGKNGNIEFEFPNKLDKSSFEKFEYSQWFRPGGIENAGMDINFLSFVNQGYRYVIYDTYYSEEPNKSEQYKVGIKVINIKTNKETIIHGDYTSYKGGFDEQIMMRIKQSEVLYE